MRKSCLGLLTLFAASLSVASATPSNWTGKYAPCDSHAKLLSRNHIDLGVRVSSANPVLDRAFLRAMDFWSGVLDMSWHEVESSDCAIELVDGAKSLFDTPGVAARSQYPDRADFEGWVAFNPASKLTEQQMFVISVHEIGHLLGLPHNPNGSSVMYFFTLDESVWLDSADLKALAVRHKLRPGLFQSGRLVSRRLPTL
jgi:hypothetical protein